MDIFEKMSSEGCKADVFTFNSLIYGSCKADRLEEALGFYHDMLLKGVIANSVTYNTLIHALLRTGKLQVFPRTLDVITYNALIKKYVAEESVDKAWGIYNGMLEKGVAPNNVSFNMLVNGLCRTGRVEEARKLLTDNIEQGFEPDIVSYNSIINGFCKSGRIHEAMKLLDKLNHTGMRPDIITYNTIISWCCKARMLDDAYLLLCRGVKNGVTPNSRTCWILTASASEGLPSNDNCNLTLSAERLKYVLDKPYFLTSVYFL
ncbi:hypothetical protein C5167_016235 [Papaver somniferum]|nr:hypothetical protein C5167_016235 [Papaver somniferum]